jgi:hypothetical protein
MQKLFIEGNILPGTDLSKPRLCEIVDGLSEVTGMKIFDGPSIKTPDHYDDETYRRLGNRKPDDINVVWMWDDSGGSIYIFPNQGYRIAIDLHTCKNFDARAALEYLSRVFHFRENIRYAEQTATTSSSWQPLDVHTPELKHVDVLNQLLDADTSDVESALQLGPVLESLVYQALREGWGDRLAAVFSEEQRAHIKDLHSTYEIVVDTQFNEDVLIGRATDASQYRFQEIYDRLARLEVEAAGLEPGDHIAHVGTGWPGTAIGMYLKCGIAVTCIEINPEVAENSRRGLEKLGLYGPDKLTVVCANGSLLNLERFKAVLVSAMVPSSDKVDIQMNLARLALGEQSKTSMIVRGPAHSATQLFYQPLDERVFSGARTVMDATSEPTNQDPLLSFAFRPGAARNPNRGNEQDYGISVAQRELIAV